MHDIDIRRRLRTDERLHAGDPDTRIVEELGLCQGLARVDLAVVNGTIHGYEIKSENDTLLRLPSQVAVYSRVLDYVTVVTASTHVGNVQRIVPDWWGIWVASSHNGGCAFQEFRRAKVNPGVDPFALVQLLWRDEALQVLVAHGIAGGMRSKSRRALWTRLSTELTLNELGCRVRDCLKNRAKSWRVVSRQA